MNNLIRIPNILSWKRCETCGRLWVLQYHYIEALYNRKRIKAEEANLELTSAIHRTNHELERIAKEVAI